MGEIVEVLGTASEVHYHVRWQDGHESYFFPGAGGVTILHKRPKGRANQTGAKAGGSERRDPPAKREMVKHSV